MNAKAMINNNMFGKFILGVIVFNATLIGISTYEPYPILYTLEWICIWIFVVEIGLKFYARESTAAFFKSGWNIFDIIVVGSAFVPNITTIATLLRILRVFRVLRLVDGLPELRLIVTVLIKSLTSMAYIALLMFISFYIYAVMGVELFGKFQPAEFGNLQETFFTLFRILTCDAWAELRGACLAHGNYWVVTAYFVSWVMISTFLLINLVVGAVLNNYQMVHEKEKMKGMSPESVDHRIAELSKELSELLQHKLS
jgi:voltage-gated sodium channel